MPILVSVLAIATAVAALLPQDAQPPAVPFGVGNDSYDVKLGPFKAGAEHG